MTMVESAIWIMTLSILFTVNLKMMIDEGNNGAKTGKFKIGLFLLNLLAVLMTGLAIYVDMMKIARYEEAPKVYTTVSPQVDTLQENGKTFYIYKFQDNHYPDFK